MCFYIFSWLWKTETKTTTTKENKKTTTKTTTTATTKKKSKKTTTTNTKEEDKKEEQGEELTLEKCNQRLALARKEMEDVGARLEREQGLAAAQDEEIEKLLVKEAECAQQVREDYLDDDSGDLDSDEESDDASGDTVRSSA